MNKVFPLRWTQQVNRSYWGHGPWDSEDVDREQWADPLTGYPCLALRAELGTWSGYVGVYPDHPCFGVETDILPAHGQVSWFGYTDEIRFIAPPPPNPDAHVDLDDPKCALEIVRMPDRLWFFGFDCARAGDMMPSVSGVITSSVIRGAIRMSQEALERQLGVYRDLEYVKNCCAEIAKCLQGVETLISSGRF